MDRRPPRSKRQKPCNARPHDPQNQSILGKVASKVKGLLNPSWLFNVSQWIGASNEEPGCSTDYIDDTPEDDFAPELRGSKRPRLNLDEPRPSILSTETQTWLESPPNLYITSHVPPSASQSSLVENKESTVAMNGDDHSENSEGSASTSGCSSLVSSHKGRLSSLPSSNNRFGERALGSLRGDNIGLKDIRSISSPKGDVSNRSLWSSPFNNSRLQRHSPTIAQSNQPSFNLSTFSGPSKLTAGTDRKISSPFYEGKTTFGGASSTRKMPPSVVPYQVDKSVRNQLRIREHHSEDSLEGMSSAAKRILLTLEKMSSPVMDAKKIPNSNKSPVDLSLYLAPPKHRRNSQFTPSIPTKGPPIANINTLARLTTLKNTSINRLKSSMEIPVSSNSPATASLDRVTFNLGDFISSSQTSNPTVTNFPLLPSKSFMEQEIPSSSHQGIFRAADFLQTCNPDGMSKGGGGGGGKIKTKLNQMHYTSKDSESQLPNPPAFEIDNSKVVPLSITKLPTINFSSNKGKLDEVNCNPTNFTFSSPININPTSTLLSVLPNSVVNSQEKNDDLVAKSFVFSKPIDVLSSSNLPVSESSTVLNNTAKTKLADSVSVGESTPKEVTTQADSSKQSTHWTCPECWIRNPSSELKCLACETVKVNGNNKNSDAPVIDLTEDSGSDVIVSPVTWECSSCWVRNPVSKQKCVACETSRYEDRDTNSKNLTSFKFTSPVQSSPLMFKFGSTTSATEKRSDSMPAVSTSGFNFSSPVITDSKKTSEGFTFGGSSLPVLNSEQVKTSSSSSTFGGVALTTKKDFDKLENASKPIFGGFKIPISKSEDNEVTPAEKTNQEFSVSSTSEKEKKLLADGDCSTTTSNPLNAIQSSVPPSEDKSKISSMDPKQISTSENKINSFLTPGKADSESKVIPASTTRDNFPFGKTTTSSMSATGLTLSSAPASSVASSNLFTFGTSTNSGQMVKTSDVKTSTNFQFPSTVQSSTLNFKFGSATSATETKPEPTVSTSNFSFSTPATTEIKKPSEGFSFGVSKESTVPTSVTSMSFGGSSLPVSNSELVKPTNNESTFGKFTFANKDLNKLDSVAKPISYFKMPVSTVESKTAPLEKNNNQSFSQSSIKEEEKKFSNEGKTTSSTLIPSLNVHASVPACEDKNKISPIGLKEATTTENKISPFLSSSNVTSASNVPVTSNLTSFPFIKTTAISTSATGLPFSSTPASSIANSSLFTFGTTTNSGQAIKSSGTVPSSSPAFTGFQPSQAVNPSFQFGNPQSGNSTVSQPVTAFGSTASNFTFGVKNEPTNQMSNQTSQAPAPTFGGVSMQPVIGNSTAPTFGRSEQSSGGFNFNAPSAPSNQVFRFGSLFGSQQSGNSTASQPAPPAFGSMQTPFNFGAKAKDTNQITNQAPQATPSPFGTTAIGPIMGNSAVPAFGRSEQQSTGGFNFSSSTAANPVFQFGGPEKKQATSGGFSFGTPQGEAVNSFQQGFNINTPPSFNFGATSTPAGPFQFAASNEASSNQASAPRKYKKAVRRVLRKQD